MPKHTKEVIQCLPQALSINKEYTKNIFNDKVISLIKDHKRGNIISAAGAFTQIYTKHNFCYEQVIFIVWGRSPAS